MRPRVERRHRALYITFEIRDFRNVSAASRFFLSRISKARDKIVIPMVRRLSYVSEMIVFR